MAGAKPLLEKDTEGAKFIVVLNSASMDQILKTSKGNASCEKEHVCNVARKSMLHEKNDLNWQVSWIFPAPPCPPHYTRKVNPECHFMVI